MKATEGEGYVKVKCVDKEFDAKVSLEAIQQKIIPIQKEKIANPNKNHNFARIVFAHKKSCNGFLHWESKLFFTTGYIT